ncbi:uncharacterized protein N7479_006020 [Penicillium vulpinum]|uniref:uncharacterized protein n=1 Tax=Penicillium vulpinum TaxID=29845 RepID=UPI002546D00C|nr:uncharacterized protein N7479_006020 [Penicillium vulpinum]KAJ5958870.1 hypothetical protein N7479_006020 [Penicillium vulpinum]
MTRLTKDLNPLVQAMDETLGRSRLIVDQELIDNDENLIDTFGAPPDLVEVTRGLEETVRSQKFYLLYGDYMGRVWSRRCCRIARSGCELGISVSSDVAKTAILGYAKRVQICHEAPHRSPNDKDTRDTIVSHVGGLERLLPDDQKAVRDHWISIVNL